MLNQSEAYDWVKQASDAAISLAKLSDQLEPWVTPERGIIALPHLMDPFQKLSKLREELGIIITSLSLTARSGRIPRPF